MRPFTLLIILALIIIGIGGVLFWLNTRLKHFFKIKITHWLILIYTFVLLAAAAVVPFIEKDVRELNAQEQQNEEKTVSELGEKLTRGQTEQIDKKYILTEERFEGFKSQTLTITSNLENWSYLYVERKEGNDGTIEVITFQQPFLVNGADFSELWEPPEIQLQDNRLLISSNQQSLDISIMHSPFPVRQLTNVSMLQHTSSGGEQLIYLKIPRDLELKADESLYLQYVN